MSDLIPSSVIDLLIQQGVLDKSGSLNISGFDSLNSGFGTAHDLAINSGVSEADFTKSDVFKQFQGGVQNAIGESTDRNKLSSDKEFLTSQLNDPLYGSNARMLIDRIDNRLAATDPLNQFLIPPNGNTTQSEGDLLAGRDAIYQESQNVYKTLLDFQKKQNDVTQMLADQIRLSRDMAIPAAPEKSGTFLSGGGAWRNNFHRTALPDLLIRF